jgi:hypothetical protein
MRRAARLWEIVFHSQPNLRLHLRRNDLRQLTPSVVIFGSESWYFQRPGD